MRRDIHCSLTSLEFDLKGETLWKNTEATSIMFGYQVRRPFSVFSPMRSTHPLLLCFLLFFGLLLLLLLLLLPHTHTHTHTSINCTVSPPPQDDHFVYPAAAEVRVPALLPSSGFLSLLCSRFGLRLIVSIIIGYREDRQEDGENGSRLRGLASSQVRS